jgi:hypothetical protein
MVQPGQTDSGDGGGGGSGAPRRLIDSAAQQEVEAVLMLTPHS